MYKRQDLSPRASEYGTTLALVRGVAARFQELGCALSGFDAYVTSQVLPGSGLSSSAAFEVLVGTIINGLFFDGQATAPQIAQIEMCIRDSWAVRRGLCFIRFSPLSPAAGPFKALGCPLR